MNPAKRFSLGSEVHGLFTTSPIKKRVYFFCFVVRHRFNVFITDTVLGLYTGVVRTVGELDDSVTLLNEAEKVYANLIFSRLVIIV